MACPLDPHLAENPRRWQASGQPRLWVEAHRGQWDHADWLALLHFLSHSPYWPMEQAAVGAVLEEQKRRYLNLRRWRESDQLQRWLAARPDGWTQADGLELLGALPQSEFWPLDPEAVQLLLERLQRERANLHRWETLGQARRWVEEHRGQWNHDDWLALLAGLEKSEFWPLAPAAVGQVLERLKHTAADRPQVAPTTVEAANLQRWIESGQPFRWVEERQGRWNHQNWLGLLYTLERSAFWPLPLDAVRRVVEEQRQLWLNLRRWEATRHPWRWVEAHRNGWNHANWLALVDFLHASEFWPLPLDAVGGVLEECKRNKEAIPIPAPRPWEVRGEFVPDREASVLAGRIANPSAETVGTDWQSVLPTQKSLDPAPGHLSEEMVPDLFTAFQVSLATAGSCLEMADGDGLCGQLTVATHRPGLPPKPHLDAAEDNRRRRANAAER